MTDLKPCPFCGGDAESDSQRAYRALTGGQLGNACAVYCASCEADVSVCLEDVPEWSTEEALQYVTERWNARPRAAQREAEIAKLRAKLVTYKSEVAEHIVKRREWADCIVPDLDGMSSDWINGYLWAMSELEERFSLADIRSLPTMREEG